MVVVCFFFFVVLFLVFFVVGVERCQKRKGGLIYIQVNVFCGDSYKTDAMETIVVFYYERKHTTIRLSG